MTLPKKYETKILYQNQPLELAGAAVQMAPCSTLFSLPTGNFTGNFAKPRLRERQRLQIIALSQGFHANSLPNRTGNYLAEQGVLAREQGILKSSPDKILARKDLRVMSALPPKADICGATSGCPLCAVVSTGRRNTYPEQMR